MKGVQISGLIIKKMENAGDGVRNVWEKRVELQAPDEAPSAFRVGLSRRSCHHQKTNITF